MIFRKKQSSEPLCAFGFHINGVSFARVEESDGKYKIKALEFHKGNKENRPQLLKNIAKLHKIKKHTPCAIYLTHQEYRLVVSEAPEVPNEDMTSALTWMIKDLIDFPIEEATLDIFEVPDETTVKKNINVVAAYRSKIEAYDKLFKQAKIPLSIIDIEEMALRNLVMSSGSAEQGTVVLWLAKEYGKILFVKNENIYVVRNIEMGCEYLKTNYTAMDTIALEVQRSIDYFERHFSHIPIQHLTLMPIDGETGAFLEFLNKNLSLQASLLDLHHTIEGLEEYDPPMLVKTLITLGVALRRQEDQSNT